MGISKMLQKLVVERLHKKAKLITALLLDKTEIQD